MDYKEIEIEWMKDILKDKEEYIKKLENENRNLKEELEWYHWFDNYLTNHWFDMKNLKEK